MWNVQKLTLASLTQSTLTRVRLNAINAAERKINGMSLLPQSAD
jgi:hypothetical protein